MIGMVWPGTAVKGDNLLEMLLRNPRTIHRESLIMSARYVVISSDLVMIWLHFSASMSG